MFIQCVKVCWRSDVGQKCSGCVEAGQVEARQVHKLFERNVWLWCFVAFCNARVFVYEAMSAVLEKFVSKSCVENTKGGKFEFGTQMFVSMNEWNVKCGHVLFDVSCLKRCSVVFVVGSADANWNEFMKVVLFYPIT